MPKNDNFQKHTLNLIRGDFEILQSLYPEVGASVVVRTIVHQFVKKLNSKNEQPPEIEVEL